MEELEQNFGENSALSVAHRQAKKETEEFSELHAK